MSDYAKITTGNVFALMVKTDVSVDPYPKILSTGNIAKLLKTSKYQARKAIDRLKKQGLVQSMCEYYQRFHDEPGMPVCGFGLTSKAQRTPYYKMMLKCENDYINDMLNAMPEETQNEKN